MANYKISAVFIVCFVVDIETGAILNINCCFMEDKYVCVSGKRRRMQKKQQLR